MGGKECCERGVAANVSDECHVQPDVGEQGATASRHAQRCLSAFCSKCIADLHTSISPCMCGSVSVSVCATAYGHWQLASYEMHRISFLFYAFRGKFMLCMMSTRIE